MSKHADSNGLAGRALARYRAMPRAGRWLLWFGLVTLGYFGVVEPGLDAWNSQRGRADRLLRAMQEEAELTGLTSEPAQLRASARAWFGPTLHPDDRALSRSAVDKAINDVLSRHAVQARIAESVDRLPAATTSGANSLATVERPVTRVVLTLTFDASPEVSGAVIADLEREPALVGLSSVLLSRTGDRTVGPGVVRTVLTVEAWLGSGARGGSRGVNAAAASGARGANSPGTRQSAEGLRVDTRDEAARGDAEAVENENAGNDNDGGVL